MSDHQHPATQRDGRRTARLVVLGAALVLLVWFVVGNAHSVEVSFWVATVKTSLIAVILVSAALGAVLALVASKSRRR